MPASSSSDIQTALNLGTLRSCALFTGMPPEDLKAFAQMARGISLQKGEYLFREGTASKGFFVVREGIINVHRVNALGKEQVIHFFRPGESFAEISLASETGYPADAKAVADSEVLLLPKNSVLELLRKNPALSLMVLGSMSQHLRVLVGALEDLTLKDMETRLLNWLLKKCVPPLESTPQVIDLGMTKGVLAAELGTRQETLSRALARLREAKLIKIKAREVTILDPAKLRKLFLANLGEK